MSAITSRGSRFGSTLPAMAHSDSPGCTVTETVGVTERPLALSAALAGEFSSPVSDRITAASRTNGRPIRTIRPRRVRRRRGGLPGRESVVEDVAAVEADKEWAPLAQDLTTLVQINRSYTGLQNGP